MFRKYDHVERLGHEEVASILIGDVFVFPKLDGTNASVWFEEGNDHSGPIVCCGSRTRKLSAEADNAGFWRWAHQPENEQKFFELIRQGYHRWNIYGEWLVPHTLKTYREDAWRRFYVFDVYDNEKGRYIHYEQWEPTIRGVGLDIIEPLCTYTNPSEEQLQREAENNSYLIMDGAGAGEGIVIKNFTWENRFGRQPWAKIVRNSFKEENRRAFGTTAKKGEFQIEAAIVEEFVTEELVTKTKSKIEREVLNSLPNQGNGLNVKEIRMALEKSRSKIIPQLLGTVFYELVNEEIWTALKKHKFPIIDFKKLRSHCIVQTKKHASNLF